MKSLFLLFICLAFNLFIGGGQASMTDSSYEKDGTVEVWVHHFTRLDEGGNVLAEGDAYMEHHTDTDSMYVYVEADVKHDFGSVSVKCLVPGTFSREKDSCSFAYSDSIKLVCEFKDDYSGGADAPTLEQYQDWFSVARVVHVDSMKEMAIISSSESNLVLEGRYNDVYTFDFRIVTDLFPSRMEIWNGVQPKWDEILAISNMSLDEFWEYIW